MLATEANLTSLNLGSNEIGEKGAVTLFEAVARGHSLTALNVSSNGWPSPPPPDKKRGESAAKSGGGGDGSGAETAAAAAAARLTTHSTSEWRRTRRRAEEAGRTRR